MAMLDMLIELRKRYSHVRYTDAVRQGYDRVISAGKAEQYYGYVTFIDAANSLIWPC